MRVDLGENKAGDKRWAELVDLDDLPRKILFKIEEEAGRLFTGDEYPQVIVRTILQDLMIAYTVTAWSEEFGGIPDKDPERVRELPNSAYKLLADAIEPYLDDVGFIKRAKELAESFMNARLSGEPADTSG